ncbi:MAG: hypothetical protein AAGC57_09375 [Pseudomonadota bacterium]
MLKFIMLPAVIAPLVAGAAADTAAWERNQLARHRHRRRIGRLCQQRLRPQRHGGGRQWAIGQPHRECRLCR